MKPGVAQAIEELREAFPDSSVQFREDDDGGAFVAVYPVDIGVAFEPTRTWIGFHLTWPYPDADVYPLFIDAGITYVGGGAAPNAHADGPLPTALSRGAQLPGFDLPAIQISRRSNRRNIDTDTAVQKVLRVVEFLRSR
jgi:hypothetical protein